ncbi:MAG: FHA domain-containing protein [Planctomycetota bacterium]
MPEEAGPTSQLSLVYTSRGQSVVHPLPAGPTSIGSAIDNDVVIQGDGVQPHHVVLTLDTEALVLRDLFAGETTVNDERRTSGPLRAGDVLGLGRARLRVLRVATTSRRTRRPNPKDDTTKRASRRNLPSQSGASPRSGSSRRMRVSGPQLRPSDSSARHPRLSESSGRHPRLGDSPTSGRQRRPAEGDGSPTTSGARRRGARNTKDWLGELNGDPDETQGMRRTASGARARPKESATAQVLEERVKRLTARLRKAETLARSAQERLKHLEQELASRPPAAELVSSAVHEHLDLASLHELCTAIVDEPEIVTVLEHFTESLLETFRADRAVSILTEEDGRNPLINVERVRGAPPGGSPENGVAPDVLERTLHRRRVLEVEADDGYGLAAPILRSGRTFGLLYFERKGEAPIRPADVQLMNVFATLACLVIQPLMSEELT